MKKLNYTLLTILVFFFVTVNLTAQDKWYYYSSLQVLGSSRQSNSYFLYNGIRYQAQDLYLSLNIPLVFNHDNALSTNTGTTSEDILGNDGTGVLDKINFGDIYINGSYKIIPESESFPSVSVEGYIKLPTAPTDSYVGSGSSDYQAALGLRKILGNFFLYGQIGYLFFGTQDENILNPLTISSGIGYAFGKGKHSIIIGYDSYSTVIQGTDSPEQIAAGYNYMIKQGLFLNFITSKGLNNSTSDYSFSGGINLEL